jgi:Contractile injection system tube protein
MSGFSNRPKILRGAFVEYGLSVQRLFVGFQFNPEQLSRSRSLSFGAPASAQAGAHNGSLRDFHRQYSSLTKLRDDQVVTVQEETISFDIRLDASDKLDEGNEVAEKFGIAPELSALELLLHPKEESLVGQALGSLLGASGGFSFARKPNPPLVLFIWGRQRVLPVNINSLNITEVLYNPELNPVRATASVSLTVIEGKSVPYLYTKAMKEAMSLLNTVNAKDTSNIVIPG